MKKHLFVLGVCLLSLFIISCKRQNAPNTYSVIPYPNSLVQEDGTFVFNKKTKMICTSSLDSASQEVVRNFSALLNNVAGLKTECIVEEEKREKNKEKGRQSKFISKYGKRIETIKNTDQIKKANMRIMQEADKLEESEREAFLKSIEEGKK